MLLVRPWGDLFGFTQFPSLALRPTILIPVPDNAVDTQNFEYNSSTVDKPLYVLLQFLLSRVSDAKTSLSCGKLYCVPERRQWASSGEGSL